MEPRGVDVLFVVPYQPLGGLLGDAHVRQTVGAHFYAPLAAAVSELEGYLGRRASLWDGDGFAFDELALPPAAHRSLCAVTLATLAERAGLRWAALDPGAVEIAWYRRELERRRHLDPAVIGISTTFVTEGGWARDLVAVCRRAFPRAKIVLGGAYYATDAEEYLSIDADVLFVGAAEGRLPEVVRRLVRGGSLDSIGGLYQRRPDGRLVHTGPEPALDFSAAPRPDWRLAPRIHPPVSLETEYLEMAVETQRGCVFKCEFCTYRTLSSPNLLSPEAAADAIFATRVARRAGISLTDATATFPRARWAAILDQLVARGGAPHPVWAYARVNDIDDAIAERMARANVRAVFIGQESGDDRMLKAMKKGTRASQVGPAVRALSRHDLTANLSFISGFPGETSESAARTRRLIAALNDASTGRPTVFSYRIFPFALQDFATVGRDPDTRRAHRRWAYASDRFDVRRAAREALRTVVDTSRVPNAPTLFLNAERGGGRAVEVVTHPRREVFFRWLKALDQAMSIFLAHRVFQEPVDRARLRALRRRILSPLPPRGRAMAAGFRVRGVLQAAAIRTVGADWRRERARGPGALTRTMVAASSLRATGRLADAQRSFRTASFFAAPASHGGETVERFADALVERAAERAHKAKLPVLSRDDRIDRE